MDDRDAKPAGSGDVRHLILDRGRDDQRRAVVGDPAPVLWEHAHAEALELGAAGGALAAVERPVAAARPAPAHHLELGERAHPAAPEPRVVEAPRAARI